MSAERSRRGRIAHALRSVVGRTARTARCGAPVRVGRAPLRARCTARGTQARRCVSACCGGLAGICRSLSVGQAGEISRGQLEGSAGVGRRRSADGGVVGRCPFISRRSGAWRVRSRQEVGRGQFSVPTPSAVLGAQARKSALPAVCALMPCAQRAQ